MIQVPLGARSAEGTLTHGVHGLPADGNGSVIFAVTKLKVWHGVTFKVTGILVLVSSVAGLFLQFGRKSYANRSSKSP